MHNWKLAAEDIQVSDSLIYSEPICTRRGFHLEAYNMKKSIKSEHRKKKKKEKGEKTYETYGILSLW